MATSEPTGRFTYWLLGRGSVARLTAVHCVHSVAEAAFAVSLAGSIFFSVSPDAARPRVLLFLAVTLAPFLLLAPLIGPLVDRLRGGLAVALVATFLVRALLAILLAQHIRSLLLFPIAFGLLIAAKAYTIVRNAAVPSLVADRSDLVAVNARLSRSATLAGILGGAIAVAVYTFVSAPATLMLGSAWYLVGLVGALRLRTHLPAPPPVTPEAQIELVRIDVSEAVVDMMALRAAIGFALFQFGFSLRADGEPAWVLGALLAANSLGAFAGTLAAPRMRARMGEHTMFTVALIAAAIAAAIAAGFYHPLLLLAGTGVIGASASVGRRALDATIQSQAPHARTARVYARLETRLELAWVAAACLAVGIRVASWIGVLLLAAFLTGVTVLHVRRRSGISVLRPVVTQSLPERLLLRADTLTRHGFHDEACVILRSIPVADSIVAEIDSPAADAEEQIERVRRALAAGADGG